MHSSIALIYYAVLATKWPISWQVTHYYAQLKDAAMAV